MYDDVWYVPPLSQRRAAYTNRPLSWSYVMTAKRAQVSAWPDTLPPAENIQFTTVTEVMCTLRFALYMFTVVYDSEAHMSLFGTYTVHCILLCDCRWLKVKDQGQNVNLLTTASKFLTPEKKLNCRVSKDEKLPLQKRLIVIQWDRVGNQEKPRDLSGFFATPWGDYTLGILCDSQRYSHHFTCKKPGKSYGNFRKGLSALDPL